ncbi:MAG: response regulator, partial [Magnetococcales bacterium]|nr:response regulator [Magnetococcales bacterium]
MADLSTYDPLSDVMGPEEVLDILLIDDQQITEILISRMLAESDDLTIHYCSDPRQASEMIQQIQPSVILLDIVMPEIDGLTLLAQLRLESGMRSVPIIMLSTEENPEVKARAFNSGANDYLIKLPDKAEMVARLRYHAQAYQNHKARQRAENKYRSLFEHSRDAIFLTEMKSGRIVDCNSASERLMNMSRTQIIGMHQPDLHSPRDVAFYKKLFDEHIQKHKEISTEIYIQRPDGERIPVDVTAVVFEHHGRLFSQWMFRDISERSQLMKSLEEILDVAEAANKAKSEFLATMSHEIRTPINVIIGMGELLKDPENTSDQQKRYINTLSQSSEALLALINDILDLSKVEAGQLQLDPITFDLRNLIQTIETIFSEPARKKGLELKVDMDPVLPDLFMGDEGRLRQILMNLLSNAIKFTETGNITVRVKKPKRPGEEHMVL